MCACVCGWSRAKENRTLSSAVMCVCGCVCAYGYRLTVTRGLGRHTPNQGVPCSHLSVGTCDSHTMSRALLGLTRTCWRVTAVTMMKGELVIRVRAFMRACLSCVRETRVGTRRPHSQVCVTIPRDDSRVPRPAWSGQPGTCVHA
jgi:hypothetical protein